MNRPYSEVWKEYKIGNHISDKELVELLFLIQDTVISEWSIQSATISDGSNSYDDLNTVGFLKHQCHKVWGLTPNPITV